MSIMSEGTKKNLTTYSELAWKIAVFLGIVANLWLRDAFVTRVDYRADQSKLAESLTSLNSTMQDFRIQLVQFQSQTASLADHEQRLRALERKP